MGPGSQVEFDRNGRALHSARSRRLDISAALKGQEKIAQGRVEGVARSGALGHRPPTKGHPEGVQHTSRPHCRGPFQGADNSLGSQPRAALQGLALALLPGLDCGGLSGRLGNKRGRLHHKVVVRISGRSADLLADAPQMRFRANEKPRINDCE